MQVPLLALQALQAQVLLLALQALQNRKPLGCTVSLKGREQSCLNFKPCKALQGLQNCE